MSNRKRKYYKRVASELHYENVMPNIMERLERASNELAAERILIDARHHMK